VEDYFAEQPLYPESMFRTRFRMNRDLFLRIVNALVNGLPISLIGQIVLVE
jgi:hypothetical protein